MGSNQRKRRGSSNTKKGTDKANKQAKKAPVFSEDSSSGSDDVKSGSDSEDETESVAVNLNQSKGKNPQGAQLTALRKNNKIAGPVAGGVLQPRTTNENYSMGPRKATNENYSVDTQSTPSVSGRGLINTEIITVNQDYEDNMLRSKVFQEQSSKQEVIKKYVNTTLFRQLKFIANEGIMDLNGRLATRVMADFGIMPENQNTFWDKQKGFINSTIRTKRNNIGMTLKENYMSTYWFLIF